MGVLIFIVIVAFVALMIFPRVTMAAAFIFMIYVVENSDSFFAALPFLLGFSSILGLALQLSTRIGCIRSLKSHKPLNIADVLSHVIISEVVIVVGLLALSLLNLFLHKYLGFLGELLTMGLNPVAGFLAASLIKNIAESTWGTNEEIEKGFRQQRLDAERKKQEEEQRRIAAERAAEREAERQRIAAEQEAQRQAREAERAAEMKRVEDNKATVLSFWDLIISDYNVNPDLKWLALGGRRFDLNLGEPQEVWVRNDERIKKMEDILRSAGFHVGSAIGGRLLSDILPGKGLEEEGTSPYQFESPFLDAMLYTDAPITLCAQNFLNAASGKQHIEHNGRILPDEYTFGFHDCVDSMIYWANDIVMEYFADYKKEYEIIKSGLKGEYAVQEILDMHSGAFMVLHDIRLEFPSNGPKPDSVEIDTLVLAPNGIFAIEVKNYGESGRFKIVVTSDGNWYKEYPPRYEGEEAKREQMQNPFAQNDRHVAYLERFINELLGRGMDNWAHVENIICISNDTVVLENDPGAKQTLTRVSNLYNHLTYDRTTRFSVDELSTIKQALESKSLPGKKYPLPDHSENLKALSHYYNFLINSRVSVIHAAGLCIQDHPEFFDMIQ